MDSTAPTVIVLIDDDQALLDLLVQLLSGPGRSIDTVCGGNGLSLDLLAMSQPQLIILNPNSNGLTFDSTRELIAGLRKSIPATIVLMVEGLDAEGAATRLGADTGIELKVLLRDPLAKLRLNGQGPAASAPVEASGLRSMGDLAADDILSLELSEAPAPPRIEPVALQVQEQVRESPAAVDLAALIGEELTNMRASSGHGANRFTLVLDTVGDDALYADPGGNASGVFVATALSAAIGDPVQLDVSFPWGQKLSWNGTVSWVASHVGGIGRRRKPGLGVSLTGPTDVDAEAMARLSKLRVPMRVPHGVNTK